ncbi:MAG TPA: immunoglobulin domain-containing protein, partial [Verrucomicrobiae bacterium]
MPRTIRLKTALTVLGLAATLVQPVTAGAQTNTNALDAASNYSSFTGNQGFGFGPWTLSTAGGGAYLSGDTPKLWGIWNNTANAVSSATRTFNTPLAVGSTFTCDYRLGNLDSTRQTNAVRLLDAGGNVVFSFYHLGGDNANGWYTDASGTGVATGFTYNYAANTHLRFALTSANAYTFSDDTTGASFTGTTTGATITQVQFWRANGDSPAPGNRQDLKFSNLMVTSPAGTPPAISAQPVNGVAIAGSSATISAAASSSQPLNYQWYFNNNALAGATANNLVLPTVGLTNAGNYVVVAYNSLGAATSSVAVLAVLPFGYTNAADVAANYSSFTGNQGFGFGPWVLSTAGGGSYLSGDHPPEFGIWNNTGGGASRATRALTTPLSPNASFLVQLQIMSLDNSDNQDGIELHDAAGNVLFSYWHQGGDTTDGHYQDANGPGTATGFAYDYGQLDAFAFTLTSANTYTFYDLTTGVNFSGILAGGPIAEVAFVRTNGSTGGQSGGQDFKFTGLTVVSTNGNPPTFTQQPQYNGGLAGATLTLNSAAVSTLGNPGYQWFFNQTSLTGRTNATLLLTNLSTVNAGNYFVVATNIFGRTTSAVAVVTVYLENERLLAYEGFNYSADPTPVDNTTQNGGYGWNGAWQIVGGTGNFIMSGSLAGAGLVP